MNYFEYYNIPSYKFGGKGFLANMANYGRKLKEFFNTMKASKVNNTRPANQTITDELVATIEIPTVPAEIGTHVDDPEWIKIFNAALEKEVGLKVLDTKIADATLPHYLQGDSQYQIIPGGRVDKYAKFMEGRFGEKLPEDLKIIGTELPDCFGGYASRLHLSALDPSYINRSPAQTAIHEIVSHSTDPSSWQKVLIKNAQKDNIPYEEYETQWMNLRNYLNDIRNKYFYKAETESAFEDYELRATANEARERILKKFFPNEKYPTTEAELNKVIDDNFTNDRLVEIFFGDGSAYTKDYKALYNKMSPEEKQTFAKMLRHNFKYAPALAAPLSLGLGVGIMNNNK